MPANLSADDLPLQRIYRWERERPESIFLTQPFGGGNVRDWTWGQAVAEIRRIATWLKAQEWEPGSRVAILSRNCAWWIMADLAIWMAGHVTVPIYPSLKAQSIRQILEHCGAKACFLGATDEREATDEGIPPGVACVRFPTAMPRESPTWDVLVTANRPMPGHPVRAGDELSTIIYTSGTTGTPKGVMHTFNTFGYDAKVLAGLIKLNSKERVLSYLPLAHIVERAGMEGTAIYLGYRVFFSEGIDTFLTDLSRAKPTIFLSVTATTTQIPTGCLRQNSGAEIGAAAAHPDSQPRGQETRAAKTRLGQCPERRLRGGSPAPGNPAVVSKAGAQSCRRLWHDRDLDHSPPRPGFGPSRFSWAQPFQVWRRRSRRMANC
jgi:long-chain acyl-CoA synthetase